MIKEYFYFYNLTFYFSSLHKNQFKYKSFRTFAKVGAII